MIAAILSKTEITTDSSHSIVSGAKILLSRGGQARMFDLLVRNRVPRSRTCGGYAAGRIPGLRFACPGLTSLLPPGASLGTPCLRSGTPPHGRGSAYHGPGAPMVALNDAVPRGQPQIFRLRSPDGDLRSGWQVTSCRGGRRRPGSRRGSRRRVRGRGSSTRRRWRLRVNRGGLCLRWA